MKKSGPELEWWVECWDRDDSSEPFRWVFHSIHASRDAACECAAQQFEVHGQRWRVLDVAKWPVRVFG